MDASALLALLHAEAGADIVARALDGSAMSSVNWSEVCQRVLAREVDLSDLRDEIEALGLVIVPFTADDAEHSAELWPSTRNRGLSLADRACLALAARLGRGALTADRTWLDAELGIDVRPIR